MKFAPCKNDTLLRALIKEVVVNDSCTFPLTFSPVDVNSYDSCHKQALLYKTILHIPTGLHLILLTN